jgi:hypothetical protein
MKARITVFEIGEIGADVSKPTYQQDFENIDLGKLVAFLNTKKRSHRKKAEKEKEG